MTLEKDGFMIFKKVFSVKRVSALIAEYKSTSFPRRKNSMEIMEKTKQYELSFRGSDIVRLAKGKYDFDLSYGGELHTYPRLTNSPQIKKMIRERLGKGYVVQIGALHSEPKTGYGDWHRDVYKLFSEEIDLKLPPYYYTLIIPLRDVSKVSGSTELIPRSHCLPLKNVSKQKSFSSTLEIGDALLMNGQIVHRSGKNSTEEPRVVLYVVFKKKWYNDY